VRFDLTVEPGAPPLPTPGPGERASGPLRDYYPVPRTPYVPSLLDFRRPERRGSRAIRMIPLTSGYLRFGFHPRHYLWLLKANGIRRRRQDTPLYMCVPWRGPNTFDRLLDRALGAQRWRSDARLRRSHGSAGGSNAGRQRVSRAWTSSRQRLGWPQLGRAGTRDQQISLTLGHRRE
jgi:hypothetical protein